MKLIIRKAILEDALEIATVHQRCWQTCYKGIVDQTYLDDLKLEMRLKNREKYIQENAGIHLVAVLESKVVGFCDAGEFFIRKNQIITADQQQNLREPGELYAIYVDPEFQHKGIGKALFEQIKSELKQKGLTPFILWTLKNNPISCQFYEALGGKPVAEILGSWGGREYLEIGYRFE